MACYHNPDEDPATAAEWRAVGLLTDVADALGLGEADPVRWQAALEVVKRHLAELSPTCSECGGTLETLDGRGRTVPCVCDMQPMDPAEW